ncbi:hypothetical protein JM654_06865 [Microbacterium oxydans]|nr:hypothetical protein [Microbacterium oxydans]
MKSALSVVFARATVDGFFPRPQLAEQMSVDVAGVDGRKRAFEQVRGQRVQVIHVGIDTVRVPARARRLELRDKLPEGERAGEEARSGLSRRGASGSVPISRRLA